MKKILLTLLVLVFASPAMATVTITLDHVQDTNVVTIGFTSDEINLVRAFGMDVTLDNDANIISATGLSADYWVYPGTIQIAANGDVTFYGSIAAEYGDLPSDTLVGPPDGNGVTLEAASLYAPVGPGSPNAPAKSGDLAEIIVNIDCRLCVSANVSRAGATGVVMENPDEVVTVVYGCVDVNVKDPDPRECVKAGTALYDEWAAWDKPLCWCYAKQCRGDLNGSSFFGKPVTLTDLNLFKLVFNQPDAVVEGIEGGICGDLNHSAFFGKRVTLTDLNMFKLYFNLAELDVPECDKTDYNWWETP